VRRAGFSENPSKGSRNRKRLNLLEDRPDRRWRAGRRSSRRVHDGEAVAAVPDLRYLIDSITRTSRALRGASQWIGDPIKGSSPLRNRDRHQVGTLIAMPSKAAGDHTPSGPDQHRLSVNPPYEGEMLKGAPTILLVGPYRMCFHSHEPNEPPCVHVDRDDQSAVFWLDPVALARNLGFGPVELRRVHRPVAENRNPLLKKWHERFPS
jgi:hypothetical protein